VKPGDRVIWLHSRGRSFLAGWRVQAIPGVIVRVCPGAVCESALIFRGRNGLSLSIPRMFWLPMRMGGTNDGHCIERHPQSSEGGIASRAEMCGSLESGAS